jgi:hypothetical protein
MMLLDVLIVCKTRSVYRDRSCGVSPVPKSEGPRAPAVWFFGVETVMDTVGEFYVLCFR